MAGAQTEKMQKMNYKNTSRKYLEIEGTSIQCETNFSRVSNGHTWRAENDNEEWVLWCSALSLHLRYLYPISRCLV